MPHAGSESRRGQGKGRGGLARGGRGGGWTQARSSTGHRPVNLTPEALHTAARMEDAYHEWRRGRAEKRGWRPAVVAYDSYGSESFIRVLGRIVLSPEDAESPKKDRNVRGWRNFAAVPLSNEVAWVRVGGQEHMVTADRGGIIDAVIPGNYSRGKAKLEMWTSGSGLDTATAHIIDDEQRFGIISDIDDTVVVTALPRPFLAAWNSFVLNEHARSPVSGMAVLYDRLSYLRPNSPILYLSTGAWNTQPALTRFLHRNMYPSGPLLLTDWGPTPTRVFRSGQDHKRTSLERLAREFPHIKWLLVGDDGQHDEEIYGEFVENHPENVAAVAIRQLTAGEAVWAGGRSRGTGRGKNIPWFYGANGAELAEQLEANGFSALPN